MKKLIIEVGVLASPILYAFSVIFFYTQNYNSALHCALSAIVFALWDIEKEIKDKNND